MTVIRSLFIVFSFFSILLFAAPQYLLASSEWAKAFAGTDSQIVQSIERTSDGGLIMAGVTLVDDQLDATCMKINSAGKVLWNKAYGGTLDDTASAVEIVKGGGYILAGSTGSFGAGLTDAWLIRLDEQGNVLWQKTYGTRWLEFARVIQQTADGGFFVAGNYQKLATGGGWDVWAMKVTKTGNVQWKRVYHAAEDNLMISGNKVTDGYVLVGSRGYTDSWAFKIDLQGKVVWEKIYVTGYSKLSSVAETENKDLLLSGFAMMPDNTYVGMITKTDERGVVLWAKGIRASQPIFGLTVESYEENEYMAIGTIGFTDLLFLGPEHQTQLPQRFPGDAWCVVFDEAGAVTWQKIYGRASNDAFYTFEEATDGGYLFAGFRQTASHIDPFLMKTSSEGDTCSAVEKDKKLDVFSLEVTPFAPEAIDVKPNRSVVKKSNARVRSIPTKTFNLCK